MKYNICRFLVSKKIQLCFLTILYIKKNKCLGERYYERRAPALLIYRDIPYSLTFQYWLLNWAFRKLLSSCCYRCCCVVLNLFLFVFFCLLFSFSILFFFIWYRFIIYTAYGVDNKIYKLIWAFVYT